MISETCKVCGCTEYDCSQCIEKTGRPCSWIEDDLCSACIDENVLLKIEKQGFYFKIIKSEEGYSSTFYGPTIVFSGPIENMNCLIDVITDQIDYINNTLSNLDKVNNGSKEFLKFTLKELKNIINNQITEP